MLRDTWAGCAQGFLCSGNEPGAGRRDASVLLSESPGKSRSIDLLPDQHMGLQQALQDFPADVIQGDDMFFGVLPMLSGPRHERPAIVLCGTSFLHWFREDGAPQSLGLPPATSPEELKRYAAIADEYERLTNGPALERLARSEDPSPAHQPGPREGARPERVRGTAEDGS